MIKVDLVYSNYLNSPDGASRFVKTMADMCGLFAEQGIELRVITADLFSKKEFGDGMKENPSLVKKIVRFISKYSALVTILRIKRSSGFLAKRIIQYYENYQDKGSLIAFQEGSTAYEFFKKCHPSSQKILLTMHSNGEMWTMTAQSMPRINSVLLKGYREDFENTLFTNCDEIGFVADTPRKHFCSLYNYPEDRTFYNYNGIVFKPMPERTKSDTLDLVCVGSLCERKNQIGILNAIALLPKEVQKKITFRIVGDGTARLEAERKAKDLAAKILFVGSSNNVDKHLQQSNCFVLFSKDEGLPISIVEGMRSGLPIIGSRIAGIPEQIIEAKTGFVVDLDEHKLAEKLQYCVNHIDELYDMGKASYEYFLQKFTIEAMVKKYAEIYKGAMEK